MDKFEVTFEEEEPFASSVINLGKSFHDCNKSVLRFTEKTLVWIGDPCYAPGLDGEDEHGDIWGRFCDFTFDENFHKGNSHVVKFGDVEFMFGGTAHGDGSYDVSTGGSCGVDAGLLSVIPAGAFRLNPESGRDYGGVFVEVQGDCYIDERHTLHAGHVTVMTDWDDMEEEECCDDCGENTDYCICDFQPY